MFAQDATYRQNCLTDKYEKANAAQLNGNCCDSERKRHGIVSSEVVKEEMTMCTSEKKFVFKLSDLNKLFCQRLKDLGMEVRGRIHSTGYKNQILSHFLGMKSCADGQEVLIVFNADIGEVVGGSQSTNDDDEGYILPEAAKIIKR